MGDCESSYTQDHSEEESRQVLYPLQRAPESGVRMERTHLSSLSVPNHWLFPSQTAHSSENSCVPRIKDPEASELLVSISTHPYLLLNDPLSSLKK